MAVAIKQMMDQNKTRSGWPAYRSRRAPGVPPSVFYAGHDQEHVGDRLGRPRRVYGISAEKKTAICAFSLRHLKIDSRKLTWIMIDGGAAYVGESTVCRVPSEADLLSGWNRSSVSNGEYNLWPTGSNWHCHNEMTCARDPARIYLLPSFMEACSRYIVYHKLLISLDDGSAKEARPRIVHDDGGEFVNRDDRCGNQDAQADDVKTEPRYLESHGVVEWFIGTVRHETDDDYARLLQHQHQHQHQQRLDAALGYMSPIRWHRGKWDEVCDERARQTAAAPTQRRMTNQRRFTAAV